MYSAPHLFTFAHISAGSWAYPRESNGNSGENANGGQKGTEVWYTRWWLSVQDDISNERYEGTDDNKGSS